MGTIQQPKAKEEVQKDNLDSMLLLKITGMALLVAPAMAADCDSLIGTQPGTRFPVVENPGDLPGCGASRCKDPNTWVGRVWARKDYCEDNGMRLCTIQELKNGHAQGTGCKFDSKEVWSSSPCSGGRWTYNWVDGTQECRVETYGASIRCCADDAPEPTGTCPFANGMTGHGCPNLMTKSNGSCKTGKIARCVQCSGCDYYKVDQANEQASRSYLGTTHTAQNAESLASAQQSGKSPTFLVHYGDACKNPLCQLNACPSQSAIDTAMMPMNVESAQNFTTRDEAWSNNPNLSESDLKCRSLQQRWGLVAVTCPPQVHHLIYVLHCLQIGPAICQAPNV